MGQILVVWKDDESRVVEIPAAFKTAMKKAGVLATSKN
jgi:hypothetical protein